MENLLWTSEKIVDFKRRPISIPGRDTKLKKRAILKNGKYNIIPGRFCRRYLQYLRDIFTSLVDAGWIWTLQVMAYSFVGSWILFSLIWWLIAYSHSDLVEHHLPARQAETGWIPCVLNIHGFPSCFLYSLETQHTTGYGLRAITEECPEAIFIMCTQCIFGMITDGFAVGVVIAKMTRPTLTNFTVQFSRNAVVCLRDGVFCIMFRIGDLKKSRLVGVSVRAIMIHNKMTKDGELLKNFQTELNVELDETGSDLFVLWPINIVHKINEDSPFFHWSATEMLQHKFEIILMLEGTIESTGQGTNAKSSYLSNEIIWGFRFENMVSFNDKLQCYEANYKNFEKIVKVTMPFCSAATLSGKLDKVFVDIKKDDEENYRKVNYQNKKKERKNSLKYNKDKQEKYENESNVTKKNVNHNLLEADLSRSMYNATPPEIYEHYYKENYFEEELQKILETAEDCAIQTRQLEKSKLNDYVIPRNTYFEDIPEEDERCKTPPFPISWV